MRILYVTPSISRAIGGIFEVERQLARSLSSFPNTTVVTHGGEDRCSFQDKSAWDGLETYTHRIIGPRSYGYSRTLLPGLNESGADIAHLHALWMYTSVATYRWSKAKRRQYVISPNGMLEPWALRNSRWKKRIARFLYEERTLNAAACIHATTEKELKDIRGLGLRNPVAIIPSGVEVPSLVQDKPTWAKDLPQGCRVLLFLGRLHPKKGLVNFLRAWATVRSDAPAIREQWHLVMAGWDEGGHRKELEELIEHLRIADSVHFVDPQYGTQKAASLSFSDGFVLPSFSEGLPIAVLDAWSYGLPVLMSDACNLPEGFKAEAAMRLPLEPKAMVTSLENMLRMEPVALREMGERGLQLVQSTFNWTKAAADLLSVYRWIAFGESRPSMVIVD